RSPRRSDRALDSQRHLDTGAHPQAEYRTAQADRAETRHLRPAPDGHRARARPRRVSRPRSGASKCDGARELTCPGVRHAPRGLHAFVHVYVGEVAETDDASTRPSGSVLDDAENRLGRVALREPRTDGLASVRTNGAGAPAFDADRTVQAGDGKEPVEAALAA